MSFIIKRGFSPDYKSLLTRPRVSHEASEYVFDFINENLPKPSKVTNYKKFDKVTFDQLLVKMDRGYIESFNFPASFEEQQYSLDDIEYPIAPLEFGYGWAGLDKLITMNSRVEYLKHYTF